MRELFEMFNEQLAKEKARMISCLIHHKTAKIKLQTTFHRISCKKILN